MPESSLSLSFDDLCAEVADFLGYGRGIKFGEKAWTQKQQNNIETSVKSGCRQFYFPPPVGNEPAAYEWSFLRPVGTVSLASGDQSIELPDDFGGFDGPITITTTSGQVCYIIPLVGEGLVRRRYTDDPNSSGQPEIAAVQPIKGTTATKGQRFQLSFFPAANQAYTLEFPYTILADCLSGSRPYAYGGMAHAETILESCLAIAEQRIDDAASIHTAKWMERLAASMSLDRKFKAQALGYNDDRSDGRRGWGRYPRRRDNYSVTFNGVQY